MRRLFPVDKTRCRPISISFEGSDVGARLGGHPPHDVLPEGDQNNYRYLFTIPVFAEPDVEVSLFIDLPFETMLRLSGRPYWGPEFSAVVHGMSERGNSEVFSSGLSDHAMIVGEEEDDHFEEEGDVMIQSCHKMGGRVFLNSERGSLRRELAALFRDGFEQLLQLDVPAEVPLRGEWPFATGIFHLLVRKLPIQPEWLAFWELA